MFEALRTAMIDRQLRTVGVNDPAVLAAFAAVPREAFVPAARTALAYSDAMIAVAPGRWLMEPMTCALLLTHAAVRRRDRVLVIGAGYAAALLKQLSDAITVVESDPAVAELARAAGVDSVRAPLTDGWPAAAPYDLIYCDGGVAVLPPALLAQAAEGGRCAAVVVGDDGVGRATVGRVAGGHLAGVAIIEAGTPLLPGFARAAQFVF